MKNMKTRNFKRGRGFWIVPIGLAAAAAFSAAAMLLWNALVPDIFGLATINFWQALGLMVLIRVFFAGIGGHPHSMGGGRHGIGKSFRDKWQKMSAEERAEFVKRYKGHGKRDFFDREAFGSEMNGNTPKENE